LGAGFEGVSLAGGVEEVKAVGVEGEAGKDGAFLFFLLAELVVAFYGGEEDGAAVAVKVVADDGVSEGLHMDTDLVGAAGMDAELDQGEEPEFFDDFVVGEGGLAAAVGYHLAGLCGMLHYRQVDATLLLGSVPWTKP